MTNKESGKMVAQKFSHLAYVLLEGIYNPTVEAKKQLNDFEIGAIEEINSWVNKSLTVQDLLNKIYKYALPFNTEDEQKKQSSPCCFMGNSIATENCPVIHNYD